MRIFFTDSSGFLRELNISLFITDCDGCLTDGTVSYDRVGNTSRRFSVLDGHGLSLLKKYGIQIAIVTSSRDEDIEARAKSLGIGLFLGVMDKVDLIHKISRDNNIPINNIAGIGDDVFDIEFLSAIGLAACPDNAIDKVKRIPGIIQLSKKGGEGAVREFIDKYILLTC